jgi:hypothetical protein
VTLTYLDVDGRVDYAISDQGVEIGCLEVTRCTNAELKAAEAVFYERDEVPAPMLRQSWLLFTDGHPHYRRMSPRLVGALGVLERHGLDKYEDEMRWWLRHVPSLADALAVLDEAHVESARQFDRPGDGRFLYFMVGNGGMSDGPDGAVEEITTWIRDAGRDRDRAKLRDWQPATGTPEVVERHLFVWLDGHSAYRLTRPLTHDDRLPTSTPELPEPITDLWLVDDDTGRGWHFGTAAGWASVRGAVDGGTADSAGARG